MYHRGEQYRLSKNWNLYIFLQRNVLIDIKISIIDMCYTNMAPISKTLMFYLLHEWKIQQKCESWKIYHHAGDSCPPNRYRSFNIHTRRLCPALLECKLSSKDCEYRLTIRGEKDRDPIASLEVWTKPVVSSPCCTANAVNERRSRNNLKL